MPTKYGAKHLQRGEAEPTAESGTSSGGDLLTYSGKRYAVGTGGHDVPSLKPFSSSVLASLTAQALSDEALGGVLKKALTPEGAEAAGRPLRGGFRPP